MESLVGRAAEYTAKGECVQALHLLEMALTQAPDDAAVLSSQKACLEKLLDDALVLNNTYEVMWPEKQIEITAELMDG